jgi:hypothetical protein
MTAVSSPSPASGNESLRNPITSRSLIRLPPRQKTKFTSTPSTPSTRLVQSFSSLPRYIM